MMMNERVRELLEYLNALSQVQGAGHYVNEEIKEAVKEIRIELGLEKQKQDRLKRSRFLVFEAKLGRKATFMESMLFEATYHEDAMVLFEEHELNHVENVIELINGMKLNKTLKITVDGNIYSVISM